MAVQRLLKAVTDPYELEGHGLWTLTASIGVTLYPAGQHIRRTPCCVTPTTRCTAPSKPGATESTSSTRKTIGRARADGMRSNAWSRRSRPASWCCTTSRKINLRTGETLGVEALLRWQHPQRGLLPPGEFLPLTEAPELLVHLGDWVLAKGHHPTERVARTRAVTVGQCQRGGRPSAASDFCPAADRTAGSGRAGQCRRTGTRSAGDRRLRRCRTHSRPDATLPQPRCTVLPWTISARATRRSPT